MSTPDNVVSLCHTPSPTVIPVSSVHLQTRVWFLPGCHFSEQTKKRQNMPKLPAKHSLEGTRGQFLMRMRRRGKRETARTSENIHPLKHLTHITEKSWARRWVKLLVTAELQLYCPQTPTPVALLYRTLHDVNKHKMAQRDSDGWEQSTEGHKGPQEGVRGCRKLKGRSAQDWGTAIYAPLIQVSGGAVRVRASNKTQTNPAAWHWSSISHNSIWVQLFWRRVVLLLWTPDFHFTWAVHSPLGLLRTDIPITDANQDQTQTIPRVQNNLPQPSLHCTRNAETNNWPCFSQLSLKEVHAASFTSSSYAFSSSSSESRGNLLFLRRRLTGLPASVTWQPLLVVRFPLFPVYAIIWNVFDIIKHPKLKTISN